MMQHRQAIRDLSSLLAGELSGARRAELLEHLEECQECREWSETYEFLSGALLADHEADHPSSEQLAHLAVDAELLTAPEREYLAVHLEECDECRRELELSRSALAGAREAAPVARFRPRLPSRAVAVRLALAASLVLAAALTFLIARPDGGRRGPAPVVVAEATAHPETTSVSPATSSELVAEPSGDLAETKPTVAAAATVVPAVETPDGAIMEPAIMEPAIVEPAVVESAVEEPVIEDSMIKDAVIKDPALEAPAVVIAQSAIEAPSIITANSAIKNGAVTLRASEMVVLGDGFTIGSSASVGVEVAKPTSTGP